MISLKSFYVPTTTGVDLIVIGHEIRGFVKEAGVGKNGWVTLMAPQPGATFGASPKGVNLETVKRVPSLVIPVMGGNLMIDPWQEVFLIDEETSGRRREFFVQLFLEEEAKKK